MSREFPQKHLTLRVLCASAVSRRADSRATERGVANHLALRARVSRPLTGNAVCNARRRDFGPFLSTAHQVLSTSGPKERSVDEFFSVVPHHWPHGHLHSVGACLFGRVARSGNGSRRPVLC